MKVQLRDCHALSEMGQACIGEQAGVAGEVVQIHDTWVDKAAEDRRCAFRLARQHPAHIVVEKVLRDLFDGRSSLQRRGFVKKALAKRIAASASSVRRAQYLRSMSTGFRKREKIDGV